MTNYEELRQKERAVYNSLKSLIASLGDYIRRSKMEELSENNTISKETWEKYGKMQNPSEFFLPSSQAVFVTRYVSSCVNNTITFANALRKIWRLQMVVTRDSGIMGNAEGLHTIELNPATIRAIEEFAKAENIDLKAAWHD